MFPKRLIALTLFAFALAGMPAGVLRAQWVQSNGFDGSDVRSILVRGSTLFIGTSNGAFKSMDYGANWVGINNGMAGSLITAIAGRDMVLLAATDSGMFRTTDQGTSWGYAGIGLPLNSKLTALAAMGASFFSGTADSGIYRSTNEGFTWGPANAGIAPYGIMAFAGVDTVIVAATNHGTIYSSDNGDTWMRGDSSAIFNDLVSIGNSIFGLYYGGIRRSIDYGRDWMSADSGLGGEADAIASDGVTLFVVATEAFSNLGLFESTNNGASWKALNDSLPFGYYPSTNALKVNGQYVYLGTAGGGLFWSSDHGSTWCEPWQVESGGLSTNSANGFLVDSSKIFTVGSTFEVGFNHLFLSRDSGRTWSLRKSSELLPEYEPHSLMVHDEYLFAATDVGICRSNDDGLSWTWINSGLPSNVAMEPLFSHGSRIFAARSDFDFYYSDNDGATWKDNGLISWGDSSYAYPNVFAFGSIGTDIFIGYIYLNADSIGILRSTDNGDTWTIASPGIFQAYPESFTTIDSIVFAGTSYKGILRSRDSGLTWDLANAGLPPESLEQGVVPITLGSDLFAYCDSGLFSSTDQGESWWAVSNFGLTACNGLTLLGPDLIAATNHGIYRRPFSEIISSKSSVHEAPSAISIDLCVYPNPFSQSTVISFTAEASGYADISIVNQLGEQVAQLFSGESGAGEHSFLWSNPVGLPDGTYECLVRINGQAETLPLVLLR